MKKETREALLKALLTFIATLVGILTGASAANLI